MRRKLLQNTYLIYSVTFMLLLPVVFLPFLMEGRTFVWEVDGMSQHYPILLYYGKLLRGLLLGKGFPMVDFSIGLGFDTITTLHYYALGDPIALLSVFMSSENGPVLYTILILLRLYLAGIGFLVFCRYWGRQGNGAILGALIYVFCGFSFFSGVRHPYFLNPMIYLPFLLIGLEQVLRRRKPYLLVAMTFICTASNFYFLYIVTVMAVIYVVLRYAFTYCREEKSKIWGLLTTGLRTGVWYLLGMAMAAVIFLPVIYAFLRNGRMDSKPELLISYFHYNKEYYFYALQGVFASGIGPNYWVCLAFPAVTGISIAIVLCKPKYRTVAITFALTVLALSVPFFGYLMNGFSYITNRWDFLVSFVVAIVFTVTYEKIYQLGNQEKLLSGVGVLGYGVLAFFGPSFPIVKYTFIILLISYAVILCLQTGKLRGARNLQNAMIYLLVLGNLGFNGYAFFATQFNGYAEEFLTSAQIDELTENGEELLPSVSEEGFYRIETYGDNVRNESLLKGTNDVSAYYSLIDGNVTDYYKQLELISQRSAYRIDNQDSRTIPDALAGVKYFISTDRNAAPYAYALKNTQKRGAHTFYLLENEFALPLGYTYQKYMLEEDFRKLNALEKQNALIYSVILMKNSDYAEPVEQDMSIGITKLDFDIEAKKGIILENNRIQVLREGAIMTLKFEGEPKSEAYIHFTNLRIDKKEMMLQTFKVKGIREASKRVNVRNKYHNTYFGKVNYLVNTGYSKIPKSQAIVTFPEPVTYTYDEIQVYSLRMDHVKSQLLQLKQYPLYNIKESNNRTEGDTNLSKKGIMVFSIPYSKGWSAWVDGQRAELLKANIMYSAIELPEGAHHITLRYRTPYLTEGLLISVLSTAILIGTILYHNRKERSHV